MAREDDRQRQMPARQQPQGLLSQRPYGWSEGDWWSASPFQLMRRMQEDMDRMFGSFLGQPSSGWGQGTQGITGWSPSVDVYETDREIVVKADVPGVEPEDLEVYSTEDAIVIRGETRREDERDEGGVHRVERRFGRFERQIPVPAGTRPEEARANFRNGVLELRVPKTEEARQRGRRIPIGGVSGAKGGEAGTIEGQTAEQARQPKQGASGQERGGKK